MPKKAFAVLAISFFISMPAFAASTGVQDLERGQFALGVDYGHIFDKDMNPRSHADYKSEKIKGSDQIAGVLTYGVLKNDKWAANVSGKLGGGDLTTEEVDSGFGDIERIEYDMGFLWGFGGNVKYKWNPYDYPVDLTFSAQYTQWNSTLHSIDFNGEKGFNITGTKNARVSEFQTAILMSTKIESPRTGLKFVPYAGPSFNWTDLKTGRISYETNDVISTNTNTSSRADRHFGLVVGLDILSFNDSLKLTLEGRFITEEALTLSLHYAF